MSQFSVPPFLAPAPPPEGAPEDEQYRWRRRTSVAIEQISDTLDELGDAFISSSAQLATGVVDTSKLEAQLAADIAAGVVPPTIDPDKDVLFSWDRDLLSSQALGPAAYAGMVIAPNGKYAKSLWAAGDRTNLLENAAFEDGAKTSWTTAGSGTVAMESVDTNGFTYAVKITDTDAAGRTDLWQAETYAANQAGNTFRAQAYVKVLRSNSTNAVRFQLNYRNSAGTFISADVIDVPSTATQWTLYTVSGVAPASTYEVRCWIRTDADNDNAVQSVVLATGFTLLKNQDIAPYAVGAKAAAKLEYPTQIINAEAGTIFGWVYIWNGAPHSSTDGARTAIDVREAAGTTVNAIRIQKKASSTDWNFLTADSAGNTWVSTASVGTVPGWHSFGLVWDRTNTTVKSFWDGAVVEQSTTTTALAKEFTAALHSAVHIGTAVDESTPLDSLIDNVLFRPSAASDDLVGAWDTRDAPFVDPALIEPFDVEGPPTATPAYASVSTTARNNGEDVLTITWTYSQPDFLTNQKLADGFVIYVKSGSTATPWNTPDAVFAVEPNKTKFSFVAPNGQSWSFGMAAVRRTRKGLEIGTLVTNANWKGIGGTATVNSTGMGTDSVTTVKIVNDNVTTAKRQDMTSSSLSLTNIPAQTHTHNETGSVTGVNNGQLLTSLTGTQVSHSLGRVPVVIISASGAYLQPIWVTDRSTTIFKITGSNFLTTSQTLTVTYDYW